MKGAVDSILRTLDSLALNWDGRVTYQSKNLSTYEEAINVLESLDKTYRCRCTRRQLPKGPYPGNCRNLVGRSVESAATRLTVENTVIEVKDLLQGSVLENLTKTYGDFLIRRKDGKPSYQLAVVVDDNNASVTEIVRGTDLLDSTACQIYVRHLLGYEHPQYMHIPIVKDNRGVKLSKQTGATPIEPNASQLALLTVLRFLGFKVPKELNLASPAMLLQWAIFDSDITLKESVHSKERE